MSFQCFTCPGTSSYSKCHRVPFYRMGEGKMWWSTENSSTVFRVFRGRAGLESKQFERVLPTCFPEEAFCWF